MSNWLTIITDVFSTWHIARGTGLTAYVLLFLITGGGLALSLQLVPPKIRAGFLGVHRTASIAAAIMLLLHGSILIFGRHVAKVARHEEIRLGRGTFSRLPRRVSPASRYRRRRSEPAADSCTVAGE